MKTKLITLIAIAVFFNSYAQNEMEKHIINDNAQGAAASYPADLDNDGDMDVISASQIDGIIAWYENLDGEGNFGPKQILNDNAPGAYYVYAEDIDGDDDMDVLSASQDDDTIAWYENLGGGNFSPKQIITDTADFAQTVYAVDIDADGDMDVLSGSGYDQKVAWHENVNGDGSVWIEHIISTEADGVWSVYAADLDGDGDPDVLAAAFWDNKIVWYENTDGLGTFGPEQLITVPSNTYDARFVRTGDLDGDGDLDVVSASRQDNKIAWYENLGGGDFGDINTNQIILTDQATFTTSVSTVDFDGDGDLDILFNALLDHKIALFVNLDGQGNFSDELIFTTTAGNCVTTEAVDINGDGFMDVVSNNYEGWEITWYEGGVLAINEFEIIEFSVYPSPTTGILNIQSKTNIVKIEVYNQLGQLILSNTNQNTIDISRVNQGVYFIKIMDEYGIFGTQKVIKK